eukprot:jgi/Tetstr1/453847/TSEL_004008.t1
MVIRTPSVQPVGRPAEAALTASVGRDVQRAAESLFETRSVAEIRTVESNTRRDIEGKKVALRQLVGDSYRDLIASADTIMQMADACNTVVRNIGQMQGSFAKLSRCATHTDNADIEPEHSGNRKELHAIGGRMKYLVDSPEEIWGCLDTLEYLEAAWRYLRALEVHKLLTSPSGSYVKSGLMRRFPLLRHQWPTVEKFRSQIVTRVTHRLSSEAALSAHEAAVAIAAAASLQGSDSAAALAFFLERRRAWVASHLGAAGAEAGRDGAPERVAATLAEVAGALQLSVCHIGELFLRSAYEGTPPMLEATVADEDELAASELIFEGTSDGSPSAESAAWVATLAGIRAQLVAMPPQEVEGAASKWLEAVAGTFKEGSLALLRECQTPAELSAVEVQVRGAMKAWSNASADRLMARPGGAAAATGGRRSAAAAAAPAAPLGGSAALQGADGGREFNWQGVCDWVLGRQLDLWELLFEAPFMTRAKELVAETFSAVGTVLSAPLEGCLLEVREAQVEGPGQLASAAWPYDAPHKEGDASAGDLSQAAVSWRQMIPTLKKDFDKHLKDALEGCLALLVDPSISAPTGERLDSLRRSLSHRTVRKRGRVTELEPYVQARCGEAIQALVERLRGKLAALPQRVTPETCVQDVEQVLLIGRLALSLGEGSHYLRVILGNPEEWYAMQSNSGGGVRGREYLKRGSAQLTGLQAKLTGIGHQAHALWAAWAAASLKQELKAGLLQEDALTATTQLNNWQETVLGEEDSVSDVEMRFSLPMCPTSASMLFLLRSCRELQRAGGHMISNSGLQIFEWELGEAVISAMAELLEGPDSRLKAAVTEKGVLQLLLDARYLMDVLAGGRPAPSGPPSAAPPGAGTVDPALNAALAQRKKAQVEIESMLQDRLDPIDWATYEPYLWANEACFYQRAGVLAGSLGCLQPLHAGASGKLPASAETNTMNVSPALPRFAYLPISQPQVGDRPKHNGFGRGPTARTARPRADALDECYSFADLGSRSLPSASAMSAPEDASAFADLRSRITSKGAVLGSIFSDKAAEVANIASSSFVDFPSLSSGSNVFTSAFSSAFSSAKR